MKRVLVFLLLMAAASLALADDAMVLPKGVIRTYVTGAYGFVNSGFDADGNKVDVVDTLPLPLFEGYKVINVGGAIEFGVTDWMSAAVQWAPGWNVWSSFENPGGFFDENTRANGPFDVFAGAKIQVIGNQGLVKKESFRFAFAPGVKIALPDPDWQEQADNLVAGDPWIAESVDKHAWGMGGRAYLDYVINDMFYVNLYSEFIYYLKKDFDNSDLYNLLPVPITDAEIAYGYDLTFEAEPHFEKTFADSLRLGIGLPVTYSMSPETEEDGVGQDNESYMLSVGPSVSLFLMNFVVPMEFKVGYTLPLLGKNRDAMNTIVLQAKTYLKF